VVDTKRLFVEQKVPKVILALSTNISPIFSTIELTLPGVMSSPGRDTMLQAFSQFHKILKIL
jgi:hypothetical protein